MSVSVKTVRMVKGSGMHHGCVHIGIKTTSASR